LIASSKHRGIKRLFEDGDRSGLRADMVEKMERILSMLDAASTPQALDLSGYRLHSLRGQ
jgi:proteic killer suppression protein